MKKVISIVLSSVLALGVLAGCAKTPTTPTQTPAETPAETPVETPAEAEGSVAKLGLGIVTSIAKSKDLAEGKATAQVDTVMAAVGFDKDGKIVSISIDTAQDKVGFDDKMALTSDTKVAGKTKKELGNDYGMKTASKIGKEWFEQIAEFEKWVVGKTAAEVAAMKLTETVPAEEDLKTLVTIKVADYIKAIEKASKNAIAVKGGEKVGLGAVVSTAKSKSAEGENGAVAQVDTTIVATVLDKAGKVAGSFIDVAQTKVAFDKDGKVTTDKTAEVKSKVELGDAYGMKGASKIGKEWFEQAKALQEWMVGKTPAEVTGMKLAEGKADVEELKTSVTVSVGGYLEAFKEAAANVK